MAANMAAHCNSNLSCNNNFSCSNKDFSVDLVICTDWCLSLPDSHTHAHDKIASLVHADCCQKVPLFHHHLFVCSSLLLHTYVAPCLKHQKVVEHACCLHARRWVAAPGICLLLASLHFIKHKEHMVFNDLKYSST